MAGPPQFVPKSRGKKRRCPMSSASTSSAEFTLTLSGEERRQLLTFLEQALRDKEVEEHRTEAFKFRELVRREGLILRTLIAKLNRN
jgi:hypothetical protein